MISVEAALAECLALTRTLPSETIPLRHAAGRVLAAPIAALRDQPPFAASVMDGYALDGDAAEPGASFAVVGEAPAGRAWPGTLGTGQALRIFTGAPIPDGATRVIIQEDVTRDGDTITLSDNLDPGPYIRPSGRDFAKGATLSAPRRLTPADIALAASMGADKVTVTRRPVVAIMATGDELVAPGEMPRPDQIIASNSYGLAAMAESVGATARILPIARDTKPSLTTCFALAQGADLIVTIGGASVGDHDLVGPVAESLGLDRSFYKIAMRPGKPLMAGRMGDSSVLGLPGNPVSSMVCGQIFMLPMLAAFQGLDGTYQPVQTAELTQDMPLNGPRAHYMRAILTPGSPINHIAPADSQDSALLTRLASANALILRAPHAPAAATGDMVPFLPLPV